MQQKSGAISTLHSGSQPMYQLQKAPDITLRHFIIQYFSPRPDGTLVATEMHHYSLKFWGEILPRLLKIEEHCLCLTRREIREKRATCSAIIDTKRIKTLMAIAQLGCSFRFYTYILKYHKISKPGHHRYIVI